MGKDRESKKAYDKRQMVFVAFKLFRQNGDRQNDQDIIDFLDGKVKGELIKKALRYYISAQENGKLFLLSTTATGFIKEAFCNESKS